jgi:hypothetical protein
LNDQSFGNVVVNGVCQVSAGPVTILGNLTVASTSDPSTNPTDLDATYALNDRAGDGSPTSIEVKGNIDVDSGGVLAFGCAPVFAPCSDDASLGLDSSVGGSVITSNAFSVSVDASTVGGRVTDTGGGGGTSCSAQNASSFKYDVIGGGLTVTGLRTCHLSLFLNDVGGSIDLSGNRLADAGGDDVVQNVVRGSISCTSNEPAAQFGQTAGSPNIVTGSAGGQCGFGVRMPDGGGLEPMSIPSILSFWLAQTDGSVDAFGRAPALGGFAGSRSHIAAMAANPDGSGYWLVSSSGGVFAFGDARFFGSLGRSGSAAPIVAIDSTPDGGGYWLVSPSGGVFAFGDAGFFGSLGGVGLRAPIVGIASSPDGRGYLLVASDGGVFAFGDASYRGSLGGTALHSPIVSVTATPDGLGYWLVASDGGVFAFGGVRFYGSAARSRLASSDVAMFAAPGGVGYWLVSADGEVAGFGPFSNLIASPPFPLRAPPGTAAAQFE